MNDRVQTIDQGAGYGPIASQGERNRVLRNTYWLLALSLLPTVLGAWLGVATGITKSLSGGVGLIVFLGGAFGFIYAIKKTKNSAAGVAGAVGLHLLHGPDALAHDRHGAGLQERPGPDHDGLRRHRWCVFFVMASLSSVIKRDLSGMGKWLFVGALAIMVGGIINVFVGSTAGMMVISVMAIGIFSAYMLYDLKQIVDGGETNYISATLALYLDIINVFQSLLALLGIMGGERD
jgi:modulator of FtsH protease